MKEKLLKILKNDYYMENDNECICPGCVFYHTTTDLFKIPEELLMKRARVEVTHAITELGELLNENKIDGCINPFLVSIVVLENLLEKQNLKLKVLRENALILGYIHSFVQYLWYAQNIKRLHPNFSDSRINKIMFNTNEVDNIEHIEIGIEAKKKNKALEGYVIFVPTLLNDGSVDMEYKFIGSAQPFGIFK